MRHLDPARRLIEVFLPVLAEAFGWSRGAISTALSINLVPGGLGMSSFYLLSATTVARWFDERRGLALRTLSMRTFSNGLTGVAG